MADVGPKEDRTWKSSTELSMTGTTFSASHAASRFDFFGVDTVDECGLVRSGYSRN